MTASKIPGPGFEAERVLSGLRDFQRKTVEHVFHRLFDCGPGRRFLVADEVGLGKTLVARGVVAKAFERLSPGRRRVDVVYVCANTVIAAQNAARLQIPGVEGLSAATRFTLLPKLAGRPSEKGLNLFCLTPDTAFDLGARGGLAEERAVIHRLLSSSRKIRDLSAGPAALANLLEIGVDKGRWRARIGSVGDLDEAMADGFLAAVLGDRELLEDLETSLPSFARHRGWGRHPQDVREGALSVIGRLRTLLAETCLATVTPELVILDEFHRFRSLLPETAGPDAGSPSGEPEAARLARRLLETSKAPVLLLSATPCKMFTLELESGDEEHHRDFMSIVRFLLGERADRAERIAELLRLRRLELLARAGERPDPALRGELEQRLLEIMCRAERSRAGGEPMLREEARAAGLAPTDLGDVALVDRVVRSVKAAAPIEYWKSAPYLLNFLRDYDLRRKLVESSRKLSPETARALGEALPASLDPAMIEGWREIPPANPRMRALIEDTVGRGLWRLLWMPPSLPYVALGDPWRGLTDATKSLIFSRWRAVPESISALCSYEAERLMVTGGAGRGSGRGNGRGRASGPGRGTGLGRASGPGRESGRGRASGRGRGLIPYHSLIERHQAPLRLPRREPDPHGMATLAWSLPWPRLAEEVDPLKEALKKGRPVSLPEARRAALKTVKGWLGSLPRPRPGPRPDARWHFAAPALMEPRLGDWLGGGAIEELVSGEDQPDRLEAALRRALGVLNDPGLLGPRPADLAESLADLALAGPGVCALRSMSRISGLPLDDPMVLAAATRIASGFRSLFNLAETAAMLQGPGPYYRRVLDYCLKGDLQAVLDEHVHVLAETSGLSPERPAELLEKTAESLAAALSLRAASEGLDILELEGDTLTIRTLKTRRRFALPFTRGAGARDDEERPRPELVRKAFNSPFRPFVLASTSIGQEGLDFHCWCHAVVHWNLPANPVDLEQREGRVNRYKGHAVRKNVAARHGLAGLAKVWEGGDPWLALFDLAARSRPEGVGDLSPYWIFEDGPARVERRIPLTPLSLEVALLERLKRGLALYRMVFGQPRQEDLALCLQRASAKRTPEEIAEWLLRLEPPGGATR